MFAVSSRAWRIAHWIISAGAKGDGVGSDGATPIWLAVGRVWGPRDDQGESFQLMFSALCRVSDLDRRNRSGESLLHVAARNGTEAVCRILVEHSADVHSLDREGRRPGQLSNMGVVSLVGTLLPKSGEE